MSFFSNIVHAVTHAAGQVVNVVKKVVSNPIVDAAVGTALVLTGVGAPIVAGIEGAVKAVGSKIGSAISDVADTLGGSLGGAAQAIAGIIGPVTNVVTEVANEIKSINNTLIQPVIGPIEAAITDSHALLQGLQADLHGGITGILKIPGTIADALTSFDASLARSMAQLGSANHDIASSVLAPAIHGAGSVPLDAINKTLGTILQPKPVNEPYLANVDITDPAQLEEVDKLISDMYEHIAKNDTWWAPLLGVLFDLIRVLPSIEAGNAPHIEYYSSEAYKALPTKILDAGSVVQALLRGITSEDSATEELLRNGLDESRQAILKELSHPLPSLGDLVTFSARSLMLATDVYAFAGRLGYTQDDFDRAYKAAVTQSSVADTIQSWHRQKLQGNTVAGALFNIDPPPAVFTAAGDNLESVDFAVNQWVNHWEIPQVNTWVQAYYRGLINIDQYFSVTDALAVPRDAAQLYIDTQRPLVNLRTIPGLVAGKVITKAEGITKLQQHGFSLSDAEQVIEYGLLHAKAPAAATATGLHEASTGEVVSSYTDGLLTKEQATTLLNAHSLAPDAVTLMLQLADVKTTRSKRKDSTADIISRVQLGSLSVDDATTQINQLGLTAGEASHALLQLQRASKTAEKVPTLAEVEAFFKHGLIDEPTAQATLYQLHYADPWVGLYLQLWGATPPTSTTAAS